MLIATIAGGVTVLTNKEVETSLQKLEFDITHTDATVYGETMADVKAILTATLGAATISISRQDGGNTVPLLPVIALKTLAEMSTNNEGIIRIDRDEVGTTTRIRFSVELSIDGCLVFDDSTKIIINLAGKVSATVFNINSIDHPSTARTTMVLENKFVNANVATDLDTTGTDVIALPIDNVTEVRLKYNNGKEVVFTQEELKQVLFDAQDGVVCMNGRFYLGYVNLALLNVEFCYGVKITLDTSTNFFVVKTKLLNTQY